MKSQRDRARKFCISRRKPSRNLEDLRRQRMVVSCGRLALLLFSIASSQAAGTMTFSINESNTMVDVEENQPVVFDCRVQGVAGPVLMIYMQEEDGYRREIIRSARPSLSHAMLANHNSSGKYACYATFSDGGNLTTGFVLLSVKSRPRHCETSEYPEIASAVPGDIVVRLCAFANPRPKLSAVSKGNQPSKNDLLLVNFKYTDTSRNRGNFIIAIANATEADLGIYSLLAFANNLESTLRFKLVGSSSSATESGQKDTWQITIIVAVVLACLLLLVVTVLVIVCWRHNRGKATLQVAQQLSHEVPLVQNSPRELRPVETFEMASADAAAEAEEFFESTDRHHFYTNAISVANNENEMYSNLDHVSAATDEQPEYLQFVDKSDQPLYSNIR